MNDVLVSVVIPSFNESGNVRELVRRLSSVLNEITHEIIYVDDSTDNTPSVIKTVQKDYPQVRLLARPPHRRTGLASAVVEGMTAARGKYVVVMDADLQHPPELVPQLVAKAEDGYDFVMPSRYINGGDGGGLSSPLRKFVSWCLRMIPLVIFPRKLKGFTDCLGGFFLVRASCLNLEKFNPKGWKISLEVMVLSDLHRVTEIPYHFNERFDGDSKASFKIGLEFFQHLASLAYRYYFRRSLQVEKNEYAKLSQ